MAEDMEVDKPTPMEARGVTSRPERIAILDRVKFDGNPRNGIDIRTWLRNLHRFFKDKNQDQTEFGRYAGHWLTGNAQKVR